MKRQIFLKLGFFFSVLITLFGCAPQNESTDKPAPAVVVAPVEAVKKECSSSEIQNAQDLLILINETYSVRPGFTLVDYEGTDTQMLRRGTQMALSMLNLQKSCLNAVTCPFAENVSALKKRLVYNCEIVEEELRRHITPFVFMTGQPDSVSYGGPAACKSNERLKAGMPRWLPRFLPQAAAGFSHFPSQMTKSSISSHLEFGKEISKLCEEYQKVDPMHECEEKNPQALDACTELNKVLASWGIVFKE